MGKTGRKTFVVMVGLLLAMGVPYMAVTAVQADPGCGQGCGHPEGCGQGCPHHDGCKGCTGCECGYPKGAGQAVPPCMQDNAAAGPGGMHAMMHGGKGAPPMRERMAKHLEETRGTVKKLREIEAKMAGQIKDGESFRALSLEHAKLLTDLQASHLKQMEGFTSGGK